MKKGESVYIGGETDSQNEIMPTYFETFFSKKMMFIVFIILLMLFLFMRLPIK